MLSNGLGCNGCFDTCGGMEGLDAFIGPPSGSNLPFMCNWFSLGCPTPEQIAKDDSNAGGSLSQANKDLATQMALENIRADMVSNPCAYSGIDPNISWFDWAKCNLGLGGNGSTPNWLLIGGAVVAGVLILKR